MPHAAHPIEPNRRPARHTLMHWSPAMRYLLATGLVAALSLALAGAAFAHEVGDVQAVEHDAYGTPPDASKEPKRAGDPVAFKELLETMTRSGLLVRFTDGSKLTVGADSKVL